MIRGSLSLANSRAMGLVAAKTPALVALYQVWVAPMRRAFSLDMTTVEPGAVLLHPVDEDLRVGVDALHVDAEEIFKFFQTQRFQFFY